jgi:ubiquinone/menaquinone biosynthesis C-methylase UbiE
VYGLLKIGAKQQIVATANSKGLNWQKHVADLTKKQPMLEGIKAEVEDTTLTYPSYYLKPFHAYETGNLGWLQAYEVELATYAVALRTFAKIDPSLGPQAAYQRLSGGAMDAVKSFMAANGIRTEEVRKIVDVGAGIGFSTRRLASTFPEATVTGLDLSPYFLALAEYYERERMAKEGGGKRLKFVHGLAEDMPKADEFQSVDLITLQYVIHECPQQATADFIAEASRRLKPNGVLMIVDNNPKSKTIQGLPPALAILMKSTEPWSDEYYSMNVEATMEQFGFGNVTTTEIDHRHRCICAKRL